MSAGGSSGSTELRAVTLMEGVCIKACGHMRRCNKGDGFIYAVYMQPVEAEALPEIIINTDLNKSNPSNITGIKQGVTR